MIKTQVYLPEEDLQALRVRWPRFVGQPGGLAKV